MHLNKLIYYFSVCKLNITYGKILILLKGGFLNMENLKFLMNDPEDTDSEVSVGD